MFFEDLFNTGRIIVNEGTDNEIIVETPKSLKFAEMFENCITVECVEV